MKKKKDTIEISVEFYLFLGIIFILALGIGFIVGYAIGDERVVTKTITNEKLVVPNEIKEMADENLAILNEYNFNKRIERGEMIKCNPDWDFNCPDNGYREKEWYE